MFRLNLRDGLSSRALTIAALATLAALMTMVIAFERIRLRTFRARVRAAA